MGGLVLYESAASSFAQKVKIVLREKGIPFTTKVPEDLSTKDTSGPLRSANPRVEVPVLIDGEVQIFDSTIIVQYIEEKWPSPSILPATPEERARARMIEDICDGEYEATNWGIAEVRWFKRAEGQLATELEARGRHHTQVLQQWLTEKLGEGTWFGGSTFSLADAAVAPIVNRSVTLGNGPAAGSPLAQWLERARERPSVSQTFQEYEKSLASFEFLAKAVSNGERRREYRNNRLEWIVKAGGLSIIEEGLKRDNIRFTWPDND